MQSQIKARGKFELPSKDMLYKSVFRNALWTLLKRSRADRGESVKNRFSSGAIATGGERPQYRTGFNSKYKENGDLHPRRR